MPGMKRKAPSKPPKVSKAASKKTTKTAIKESSVKAVASNDIEKMPPPPPPPKQKSKTRNLSHEMYSVLDKVQNSETTHNKYLKEFNRIYSEVDDNEFLKILYQMIIAALQKPEDDPFGNMTLKFICKFLASFSEDLDESPAKSTFHWILGSDGTNPYMRYRLCEFVNTLLSSLGPNAALDDSICDKILLYMTNRLKNQSANVRAQAIYALQRLQDPYNNEDIVIRYFLYHLQSDPAPKVRQAVITTIARTQKTIKCIIERLWDVDERVRRHTYLQMCGYPVKSLGLANRLTFLEQGLNDESRAVKKIVTHVMIPQWVESYSNCIEFLSALKLDSSEEEILKYQKIAKMTLFEIFAKEKFDVLKQCLAFEKVIFLFIILII